MPDKAPSSRHEVEAKIIARAWTDEAFRERLKADPRGAIADESGITVPQSISIEVLEETPEKAFLVIPSDRVAISDQELEIAGGGTYLGLPESV